MLNKNIYSNLFLSYVFIIIKKRVALCIEIYFFKKVYY